jgi:thiamine pyrophosphate-dependent acetolactate synthase large subunit-like protein
MTRETLADAIVSRLELHGVEHVFGIPGTHNLPFYGALGRSGIAHVTPRHEQGAGYAADGYTRASGRIAVCLVTSGPGVTNIVTAVATAAADSVPMLVLAPGMPADVNGGDTGYLHELRDQQGVMSSVVEASYRVRGAAEAAAVIDRAFASFRTRRPRPVYVEVPLDLLDAPGGVTDTPSDAPDPLGVVPPGLADAPTLFAADEGALAEAADLLAAADSVALVLGGGAKDAGPEALELARLLGAPVVTTVNAKGTVPETDELSLGASIRLGCVKDFLRSCAAVLAVGTELAESDLWAPPPLPLDGRLVRIDIDPAQLQKNAPADVALAGDAAAVLAELARMLRHRHPGTPPSTPAAAALREAAREEVMRDGAQYVELMRALYEVLDPDAIVASDSTMACYYGAVHFLPQDGPRQLLYPTGYATLGYGVPAAIGAKLALPDRQVMALMGDGGVMFTLQELATAVEMRLAIPVLVVKNGGYGEIRRGMVERGMEPLAVDFDPPSFADIAEGFGAVGARAASYEEAANLVRAALDAEGPTVIEVDEHGA